jgi:hypothetical protein
LTGSNQVRTYLGQVHVTGAGTYQVVVPGAGQARSIDTISRQG